MELPFYTDKLGAIGKLMKNVFTLRRHVVLKILFFNNLHINGRLICCETLNILYKTAFFLLISLILEKKLFL